MLISGIILKALTDVSRELALCNIYCVVQINIE